MSLLEDLFLEDEAGEAQELERVIEGDDYDERMQSGSGSDDNREKDDEAVEDKRRVDPNSKKVTRTVKNPRFVLNPARLTGPRGIQVIPNHYKDFQFKGTGHEKDDLDLMLKKLEHWAYRLYPKFKFEDCLKKIETLGKKRPVMVHLHKIRSDQLITDETVVQKDSSEDEAPASPQEEDEFDKLLQQQIELAKTTPAPGSTKKGFVTPSSDKRSTITMPKATSSPSITDELREKINRNRKLAEERRLVRLALLKQNSNDTATVDLTTIDNIIPQKHNRSNVIDSSDEDSNIVNDTIGVEVHKEKIVNVTNETVADYRNTSAVIDLVNIDQNSNFDRIARKHNRSNVIESSEDENDGNIYEAIDVDGHKEKLGDITNETPADSSICNTSNMIELVSVDQGANVDKISRKHNRSIVIESSDYENGGNTDVDVHKEKLGEITNDTPADSSISNTTNMTEVVSVDQDANFDKISRKYNRSNAIESSDDENGGIVKVIPLDAYDVENRNKTTVQKEDKVLFDLTDKDNIENDVGCNEHNKLNTTVNLEDERKVTSTAVVNTNKVKLINCGVIDTNCNINEAANDCQNNKVYQTKSNEINNISQVSNSNHTKVTDDILIDDKQDTDMIVVVEDPKIRVINTKNTVDKENIDNNVCQEQNADEIMDVDFIEDF